MTRQDFRAVTEKFFEALITTFDSKNIEYGAVEDAFHNFKAGAKLGVHGEETPEEALWGMAKKHLVSVMDIIWKAKRGILVSCEAIDEKIGDMTLYLQLLRGMLIERHEIKEREKHECKPTGADYPTE